MQRLGLLRLRLPPLLLSLSLLLRRNHIDGGDPVDVRGRRPPRATVFRVRPLTT